MELAAILLIILVVLIIVFFTMYNRLISLRNQVDNAWAQIDVQLKRRHDLIPNLVETAKAYMKHERETLENVTKARNMAAGARSTGEKIQAEKSLDSAMGNFMVVVENYPQLKANENFLALQEELTSTENRLGFARQAYNDQVLFFNNRIQMVPTNIIAGMFNFTRREFFEIEDEKEKAVPRVKF